MKSGKPEKYSPLNPLPPKLKKKKCKAHSVCPWPSHWLHEISPPKKIYQRFWPDLYLSQVQLFFIELNWPWQKKLKL